MANIEKEKRKIKKQTNIFMNKSAAYQDKAEEVLTEASVTTRTDALYWAGLKKSLRKEYKKMSDLIKTYANTDHPLVYRTTVKKEITRLAKMKKVNMKLSPYTELFGNRANQGALKVLIEDTILSYSAALDAGYKMNLSILTRTQLQLKTAERALNLAIAQGLTEGEGIPQISNRILKSLRDTLKGGETLRAGSKRYKFKTYSELIARTRSREVQSTAVINTAMGTDNDLVQVSSHNTTTEICQQYEGKIYSISGKDRDFSGLIETPPFHPNCQHSISIYVKEFGEINGTLDQAIKFSNGDSEIHPTRASHIPLSKRGK